MYFNLAELVEQMEFSINEKRFLEFETLAATMILYQHLMGS